MQQSLRAALHIAWMRLREQPGRVGYLVLTLTVAILAWNVLAAFVSPFLAAKLGDAMQTQLHLGNAAVEGQSFPLRHMRRIENMPGVAAVSYVALAAFGCADKRTMVTVNAIGGSRVLPELRRKGVSGDVLARWNDTRNGLLLGADLAEKCGLSPGMLLTPRDALSGVELPVSIIGVLPSNQDHPYAGRIAYGHYEYLNQMLPEAKRDQVRVAGVEALDSSQLDALAEAITREFASADPPLEANMSSQTSSVLGRFGQVQGLLGLIMAAMAACALLVFVTVMAHLLARRRASMAALQTIGFGRRLQWLALVLEFSVMALIGVGLGLVGAAATLAVLAPKVFWLFGPLQIPAWALIGLAPAVLMLALAALAWPTVQLARLKPIDALRG